MKHEASSGSGATPEHLALPGLPPSDYLTTFISNLLHYAESTIVDERAQTRVTSRIRAKQAARILATFEREVTQLRADLAAARSLLRDAQQDSERLDWLEGELEREHGLNKWSRSLFRQNVPITRVAVDKARAPLPSASSGATTEEPKT